MKLKSVNQSRLAAVNNGIARQIFEDTDAAFQMQGFFEEVKKFTDTRRAMKSIEFLYDDGLMDKLFWVIYSHSLVVRSTSITSALFES
jgi:hypothetical protein